MIVLLPLRGWAGDLMGVQMAVGGLASQATSAMPVDCPMTLSQASASADDPSPTPAIAQGCTSCDLCLPMAALENLRFDLVAFAAHAVPPTGGVAFFSALPTLAFKPPIS